MHKSIHLNFKKFDYKSSISKFKKLEALGSWIAFREAYTQTNLWENFMVVRDSRYIQFISV